MVFYLFNDWFTAPILVIDEKSATRRFINVG